MGIPENIKSGILQNKNSIYLFLFFNYIILFLAKIKTLPLIRYQASKKLAILIFLFESFKEFLSKKAYLPLIQLVLVVLVYFVLVYLLSFGIIKIFNKIKRLKMLQDNANFIQSDYFIVLFLLMFSAAISFSYLNAGLFHHDSFQLAVAVEKTVDEMKLFGIGGGRQGIVLVNSFFFYFFKTIFGHQSAEFTVNFTSALFGALSIAVLYLLVRNIFNDRFIALSSSLIYSVTPIFLSVSTFAKEHTLDVFISLSSILILMIGLKKQNYLLILFSGLFFSFLIFVRFPSILLIFAVLTLIYNSAKNDENLSGIKTYIFFIAPLIIIMGIYALFNSGTIFTEAKSNFNPLSIDNLRFVLFNNLNYSVDGIVFSLTLAGVFLALIGYILLFKENKRIFRFLLLFFIPLFVFYAISKTVAHRFFVLPLVALIIPFSYALNRIKKMDLFLGILLLILFVLVFFANIYPVIKFRHDFSAFRDLATMVDDNTNPQDSIVILYGDDTPALNYYSKTPAMSCYYYQGSQSLNDFIDKIRGLFRQGLKVYVSGACFGLGNGQEQANFLGKMVENFKGSIVAEYVSDDYHRGSIKPTIKKISMLRLYSKASARGTELSDLEIKY